MQAFQPLPTSGWVSRLEPHESALLVGIFAELAQALETEEKRDVLDMMGVNLDGNAPREFPLMFEKILGAGEVSSISSRPENPPETDFEADGGFEAPEDTEMPSDTRDEAAPHHRGDSAAEPDMQGLTDAQRLEELDFDPLSFRPVPANPYVAAILRPMSKDAEEAAELRALTTPDLAGRKAAAMRTVAAGLEWAHDQHTPVVVKPDTLKLWVTAINDVRLALGWSLGIEDDARAEEVELMAQSDPDSGIYTAYEITIASVYNALSWWLDTLMNAVNGGGDE